MPDTTVTVQPMDQLTYVLVLLDDEVMGIVFAAEGQAPSQNIWYCCFGATDRERLDEEKEKEPKQQREKTFTPSDIRKK